MKRFVFVAIALLLTITMLAAGCTKPTPALFEGTIEDIDIEESTITVMTEGGEELEFEVTPETRIIYEEEDIDLSELAKLVEDEEEVSITIFYYEDDEEEAVLIDIDVDEDED